MEQLKGEELLARPAHTVQRLFQQAGCPTDATSEWNVVSHFKEELERIGGVESVPLLTAESAQHLADHSLVRYVGMVQDLLNPEYYIGAVQQADGSWRTTKFNDQVDVSSALHSGSSPVVWERRPVMCVPVPGLSAWTLPGLAASTAGASLAPKPPPASAPSAMQGEPLQGGVKRKEMGEDGNAGAPGNTPDIDMADDQAGDEQAGSASAPGEGAKRRATAEQHDTANGTRGCGECSDGNGRACSKHAGGATVANTPAEEVNGSCLVYLYDHAPGLVLQEVVEVVGVVSHMPQLGALSDAMMTDEGEDSGAGACHACQAGACGEHDRMAEAALRAAHPPTSKVMRLHAIWVSRRDPPLVPAGPATPAPTPAAPALSPEAVAALRARALELLRWSLGGDALAAEYVLLQLLARVTGRVDNTALGQVPLNISRCPPGAPSPPQPLAAAAAGAPPAPAPGRASAPLLRADALPCLPSPLASTLQAALSCLVPLSAALPLTVDSCNRLAWAPRRDCDTERTAAAPLQLAPGTVLVVDETMMAPGQLVEQGIRSLQALASVAKEQVLPYDMEAYHHPVPCDVSLVVLTQGRSLLSDAVKLQLPLNATADLPPADQVLAAAAAAASPADGGAALPAVRSYLAAARQLGLQYDLGEGVAATLERHFVEGRRAQQQQQPGGKAAGGGACTGGITAEEFQLQLHLARLLALSYGEGHLTQERWQQLLQLEHSRASRLRVAG